MSSKLIVMVSDLDDASHGEINVLDGPDQAAEFVETLLESGFEQERIRIFGGEEVGMTVRHRPVVQLQVPGANTEARGQKEQAPEQPEAAPEPQAVEEPQPAAARSSLEQEEPATPGIRNGVRFSTQFKTA